MISEEQNRPEVQRQRNNFRLAQRFVANDRFVFLDETGVKTNMTRLYGRSLGGVRCNGYQPNGRWTCTTVLGAIRQSGVIAEATVAFDQALDGHAFLYYTTEWLAPSLRPGDVVVMDNLSSHKVAGVREAIEAAGADLWYLPPYSPDLNPIEKLWSKVKSCLRGIAARTNPDLRHALTRAFKQVKTDECRNYFRACGFG